MFGFDNLSNINPAKDSRTYSIYIIVGMFGEWIDFGHKDTINKPNNTLSIKKGAAKNLKKAGMIKN